MVDPTSCNLFELPAFKFCYVFINHCFCWLRNITWLCRCFGWFFYFLFFSTGSTSKQRSSRRLLRCSLRWTCKKIFIFSWLFTRLRGLSRCCTSENWRLIFSWLFTWLGSLSLCLTSEQTLFFLRFIIFCFRRRKIHSWLSWHSCRLFFWIKA